MGDREMNEMADTAWEELVKRYADGRTICNCGQAYATPCGHGIHKGVERHDLLVCAGGCSGNQIAAKEEIAKRVIAERRKVGVIRDISMPGYRLELTDGTYYVQGYYYDMADHNRLEEAVNGKIDEMQQALERRRERD